MHRGVFENLTVPKIDELEDSHFFCDLFAEDGGALVGGPVVGGNEAEDAIGFQKIYGTAGEGIPEIHFALVVGNVLKRFAIDVFFEVGWVSDDEVEGGCVPLGKFANFFLATKLIILQVKKVCLMQNR